MKYQVVLILALVLTSCSNHHSLEDYREMKTQVEYVNDVILGQFPTPLPDTLTWSDVRLYMRTNESDTYNKFEDYYVTLFVNDDQYLLLLWDPCDHRLIMYDFSCTDGTLDGPLYEKSMKGSASDIVRPDCAREICFIK